MDEISLTPLYDIGYAILNDTENLPLDKEGYFPYGLVFYGLFYKTSRNHFPVFPYIIETHV